MQKKKTANETAALCNDVVLYGVVSAFVLYGFLLFQYFVVMTVHVFDVIDVINDIVRLYISSSSRSLKCQFFVVVDIAHYSSFFFLSFIVN